MQAAKTLTRSLSVSLGRVGAKRRDELVFATPQTARVATQHEASETEELARFIQGDCKLQLAQLIAACNPAELSELSQALLTTYSTWPGGSETLIAWATRKHVAECSQPETLFRGTCLETKVISAYVHKECSDFVRAAVTPLLRWLRERNLALEVDPAKEPSADALQRNQALVLEGAELILSTILQNTALIPEHVSSVLRSIQSIVERKFSDMGVRSVGALLFLRLICPAMVSPDHFLGFRDSTPQLRRSMILITKLVQNLANLVTFGDKEDYLTFANAWLQRSAAAFQRFIFDCVNDVTKAPAAAKGGSSSVAPESAASDASKDLALRWLHNFLCLRRRTMERDAAQLFIGRDAQSNAKQLLAQLRRATNNFKPLTQPDMPPAWVHELGLDKSALHRSVTSVKESVESAYKRSSSTAAVKPTRRDAEPVIGAPLLMDSVPADMQRITLPPAPAAEQPKKLLRKSSTISERLRLRKTVTQAVFDNATTTPTNPKVRSREAALGDENDEGGAYDPMELSTPAPANASPLKKLRRDAAEGEEPAPASPSLSRQSSRAALRSK